MLLLHGLTESGLTWPDAVARWADSYRLFAADLRGHGRSPRFSPRQLASAPDVLLADVGRVLDDLQGPVVIVGHSLGALLALRSAGHAAVAGLVLEDPARPAGQWEPDPTFVAEQELFLARMADVDQEVARMELETKWSRAEIDAWAASKAQVDCNYIRQGLFLGESGFEERLQAVIVPTLVVVPAGGDMAPEERAITNPLVRFEWIVDAGHCVRRDRPDAYHAVVDPFLHEVTTL